MKRSLLRTIIVMTLSLLSSISLLANTYSGRCGANITWKMSAQGDLTLTGTGDMYDYYSGISPWGEKVKTVTIGDGITSIGVYAFGQCTELEFVEIGESVKTIKKNAFANCPNLKLFVVHAIEPPVMDSFGVFVHTILFQCAIEVPQGSEVKYFFAPTWNRFYEKNSVAKLCHGHLMT